MTRRPLSDESDEEARADRSDVVDHAWQAASGSEPMWIPTTDTFALPHFAEQAEWLRRKRTDALNDIVRMRALQENGQWQRRREAEIAAGIKGGNDRDSNQRIRDGLERQVNHATRLRGATTGMMPSQQEQQMIDDVVHPVALTSEQAAALRAQAEAEADRQRLMAQGIRTTPAGLTSTAHAAQYLGVGVRTLERWRQQGIGPLTTPMHGRCWYAMSDLDAYLESSRSAG